MLRYLFAALSVGISAITVPAMLRENPDLARNAAVIARDQLRAQSARNQADQGQQVRLSGSETIPQDRAGHYVAEFRLNNERVIGMIDTGASTIAINQTTARRAGLSLASDDFVYVVNTANGQIKAARTILDQVEIGSIRIRKVEAMVLDDRALDGVLIGMSFMNRLKSFEQSGGQLLLRQ